VSHACDKCFRCYETQASKICQSFAIFDCWFRFLNKI
jgi:hypothetical protein